MMHNELGRNIELQPALQFYEGVSEVYTETDGNGNNVPVRLTQYISGGISEGCAKSVITKRHLYFLGSSTGPDYEDPSVLYNTVQKALYPWNSVFVNNIGGRKVLTERLIAKYNAYSKLPESDRMDYDKEFANEFGIRLTVLQPVLEQLTRSAKLENLKKARTASAHY